MHLWIYLELYIEVNNSLLQKIATLFLGSIKQKDDGMAIWTEGLIPTF